MSLWQKIIKRATSLTGYHPRDPALAEFLGQGGVSASGASVTADTAMQVSAVFSAVRILSETIASLPLVMYRRLPDGGKERATDHPLYKVVGRTPNDVQSRFEWLEMKMAHANLKGVAYSRKLLDNRGGLKLVPLHPDRVTARYLDSGKLAYLYQPSNGKEEILLQNEVLRVPFMTMQCGPYYKPLSVIGAQRETIGESLAAQDYGSRFWANDAKPGSWIEFDGKFHTEEDRKRFRKSWQESQTGANRHKTAVLEQGMKLHELALNNADAQFLETRKYKRSEIFGIFRVPPHLGGDLERSTNNNIEQQSLEFVMYTMAPWFARFEQALSRDLLSEKEQDEYFFEFLVDGLLRGDSASRSQFYKDAIYSGWMSRNEVREIENRNKQPGLDEYLAPTNMTPAELLGQVLTGKSKQPEELKKDDK